MQKSSLDFLGLDRLKLRLDRPVLRVLGELEGPHDRVAGAVPRQEAWPGSNTDVRRRVDFNKFTKERCADSRKKSADAQVAPQTTVPGYVLAPRPLRADVDAR